jgi:hypothetical protein
MHGTGRRDTNQRTVMTTLHGGCHCGNVTVDFETSVHPGALSLRTCQCSFCRKHGARYASDPGGNLTIRVREAALLHRYRFALGVTDFVSCQTCGVYVAATMEGGSGVRGVLNVNVLDDQDSLPLTAEPMVFDGESVEVRMARRVRGWTPVTMAGSR